MEESAEERRKRQHREASARWRARNQDLTREKNREASRRWAAMNRDRKRQADSRWAKKHPMRKLLINCRNNAKRRGLECSLTLEDIERMITPMTCSATGLVLLWEHLGESRNNPWAPSIDRIDCSKGYVPDNVRVVCWAFNQARGEWPDDVLRTLFEAGLRALR